MPPNTTPDVNPHAFTPVSNLSDWVIDWFRRESTPTPDPAASPTTEQANHQLDIDDLHRRVADLRRIREEQAVHQAREPQQGSAYWDMLNGIGYTWTSNPTGSDYAWDMYKEKSKGYRPVKQPRHRLFNRRLPL